jgi:preprotein translocase subunit SecG
MLKVFETPATVVHVLACLLLVLIVLIQPGKSGGISAALGGAGAQQVFGGRGAGNFLTRGTWILASTFFLTSVFLAYLSSSVEDTLDKRAATVLPAGPVAPAVTPPGPPAQPEPAAPMPEAPPAEPAAPADEPAPDDVPPSE